jgi:hypothetical protein
MMNHVIKRTVGLAFMVLVIGGLIAASGPSEAKTLNFALS